MKAWQHLKTITRHRWLVRRGCFRVGLYWQGLTHDLSKYSPVEFLVGAKHYQGNRSPNSEERREKGYSEAWMHHKGRNRHHWEYWTDLSLQTMTYAPVAMPRKYLVEMVMDRIAACKVYQGDDYTDASALNYLQRGVLDRIRMHPKTLRELEYILTMLRDAGEEATFQYIKHEVLQGKPFPWELEENPMSASWLKNAVFYEIYPQSFKDTNGDGIGDFNGIIEKLPYIKSLGCNAIWMNPCYDSPFKDAGYDVRDHKKVAERYGTEADLIRLFEEAHKLGIKILLDLVPGHTSEEHPWFIESAKEEENEYSDRYIWTSNAFCGGDGMPFIGGEHPRDATYVINFFKCQPALNYGYRDIHDSGWQMPIDAPGPLATREAMKDIMRYWLKKGCDGFRVDMADSLVKNDHGYKSATMEVWKDIAGAIHEEFPEAALVSEWNHPEQALACGFDMDFMLDWGGNGYNRLMRFYQLDKKGEIQSDNSYFKAESDADISGFLKDYPYEEWKALGLRCLITGNHDTKRCSFNLDDIERRLAYSFIFTMPGAPFLYYGDEIGMAYRWLPTKEGGYHRTGSRSPMQWDNGANLGFSAGRAEDLYLPVDPNPNGATVENQEADPNSMLHYVRSLIALRQENADLGNYSPFAVHHIGKRLFAYKRGDYLLAVNPGLVAESCEPDGKYAVIFSMGEAVIENDQLTLGKQSFAVLKPLA